MHPPKPPPEGWLRDLREAAEIGRKIAAATPDLWRLALKIDLTPPRPKLKPKRKRRSDAGDPRALTEAEIARCRGILRKALAGDPRIRRLSLDQLVARFGPLFELRREVSHRTLDRCIFTPILGPRRSPRR